MKTIGGFDRRWLTVVSVIHGILLVALFVGWRHRPPERVVPPHLDVALVAAPDPPAPAPVTPPRREQPREQPQPRREQPQPRREQPQPQPRRETWRARDPAEIRRDHQRHRPEPRPQPRPTVSRQPEPPAPTPRISERDPVDVADVDAAALRQRLAEQQPAPTPRATGGGSRRAANYAELVTAVLYERWDQPTAAETGHEARATRVRLTIRRDGRLLRAEIIAGSGHVAMDESVRRLLENLGGLPPFPDAMANDQLTFDALLRVTP